MPLRSTLEDVRLTFVYLPLVARTRWQLWRVPVASSSALWRDRATRELNAANERGVERLVPFEVWRRAHAIGRAAKFIPQASCLTQALSLQTVLSQCGEYTSLVLGVDTHSDPNAKRNFEAHAWIEWNGRVIIGGPVERWKPLLTIAPTTTPATTPAGTTSEGKTPTGETSTLMNASSPLQ